MSHPVCDTSDPETMARNGKGKDKATAVADVQVI